MEFSAVLDAEWDAVVATSDDGWIFAHSWWQRLTTGIPEWGFLDCSFALRENGHFLAVVPLQRRPDGVLASIAFGESGPVVNHGVQGEHRKRILKQVFEHVDNLAQRHQARAIEMLVPALSRGSLASVRGVNSLIEYGFQDTSTHVRIADLGQTETELFAALNYDARRSIRAAEKSGYTVGTCEWKDAIDDYYRVHTETYCRTGMKPHPLAYFEGIAKDVASRGHSVLWVGRDPDGAAVAFHNCARYRDTATYWTGCCASNHLASGINYLLFWSSIKGAKTDGIRWYNLGQVFPNATDEKLRGLTVFKSKFGGELRRSFSGLKPVALVPAPGAEPSLRQVGRQWLWLTREFGRRCLAALFRSKRGEECR